MLVYPRYASLPPVQQNPAFSGLSAYSVKHLSSAPQAQHLQDDNYNCVTRLFPLREIPCSVCVVFTLPSEIAKSSTLP